MIRLRPATLADVPLLRRWDEEPHVVASDPHDDWQWETALARVPGWREPFIAELDGHPIGFLEIIDPAGDEERYWGDVPAGLRAIDIWIGEADARGRGHGTEMMRQALARCFAAEEVTAVLVDPIAENVRAHRFYERLGFRFVERRRFGADDCHVYRLARADWLNSFSKMNPKPFKPAAYNSVSPYLVVTDAAAAIRFLTAVFGAVELRRHDDAASGRIMHAEVRLDDTVVMLGDQLEGVWPAVATHVHVYVQDVDATFAKALAHGATAVQEPVRKGDEDKRGGFKDAGGTTWWVATKQE